MKKICVICEGQTEAEFVNTCLKPWLLAFNVHAIPKDLGGNVSVERLARFVDLHYHKTSPRITTLVDYYGFKDLDGRNEATLLSDIANAAIEKITRHDPKADLRCVFPYVQMHEFEALLFSDCGKFYDVFENDSFAPADVDKLNAVRNIFESPEKINNSHSTAPSKRIKQIYPAYNKVKHGPRIAFETGLETIMRECPKFKNWIETLQTWGM